MRNVKGILEELARTNVKEDERMNHTEHIEMLKAMDINPSIHYAISVLENCDERKIAKVIREKNKKYNLDLNEPDIKLLTIGIVEQWRKE